jgi:hypothetical protein
MLDQAQRHKDPKTLGEPFRTWREEELAIERARAKFCFFQHKVMHRSLRDIGKEQGMSYERVRHLVVRAEKVYNAKVEDYHTS